MANNDFEQIQVQVKEIAVELAEKGPGYSQEGVVLREARLRMKPVGLSEEQLILEAWHQLFSRGDLAWGYDLDNPSAPFFHVVEPETVVSAAS